MTLPKVPVPQHAKLWANVASAVIVVLFIKTEWAHMSIDAMLAFAAVYLGYGYVNRKPVQPPQ